MLGKDEVVMQFDIQHRAMIHLSIYLTVTSFDRAICIHTCF